MALPERSLSSFGYPHAQFMDEHHQWLSIVRRSIEQERPKSNTKVSIFIVPKTLMSIAPNCYTPQHVALGPNHYWRRELHDMEGYKIAAARSIQDELRSQNLDFEGLVKQFTDELETDIRACYQRFIYFDGETLAWMMAVDTAFLLEFLQLIYGIQFLNEGPKISLPIPLVPDNSNDAGSRGDASGDILSVDDEVRLSERALSMMSQMHDYAAWSIASGNAIIRDIMMLENQIPLSLLTKMLKVQFSSSEESANSILFLLLKSFCAEVCPFKFLVDPPKTRVSKPAHILDYMYRMILPDIEENSALQNQPKAENNGDQDGKKKEIPCHPDASVITKLLSEIKNLLSQLQLPKKMRVLVTFVVKVPWNLIRNKGHESSNLEENDDMNKPPEIEIPSVTELSRAGVLFSASRKGNFQDTINFDSKRAKLKLPKINLDENTEVVLRNLVAYEASNPSGSLFFTRYTELMNGIIDTVEDVKLLRESKIIWNDLKSDEEVLKLWNGMSRCIRSTNELNEVIESVNKYYNRRWMVKVERCLRKYVYESWQFLTLMAAILLLIFEMFEAFCSVYNCNAMFHLKYSVV